MSLVLRSVIPAHACTLVPMSFAHTAHVVRWRNDPEISQWFLEQRRFDSASHEAWLTRTLASDQDMNWIIQSDRGFPIGALGLYDIDWIAKRAEFGRFVIGAHQARGKGFGKDALKALLAAASSAGLLEVYLYVKDDNFSAASLYRSVGFQACGDNQARLVKMSIDLTEDRC